MKTEQRIFQNDKWSTETINTKAQLVLAFSSPSLVKKASSYNSLKKFFPNADIILMSTCGEILDVNLYDDSISVTAFTFKDTPIQVISKEIGTIEDSYNAGNTLAKEMNQDDLSYVFVFADGSNINGAKLTSGITSVLDKNIGITGGLAGDGTDFGNTYTSLNGIPTEKNIVIMVGLYGKSITVGNASVGGWDIFGIERIVTKSQGSTIYELDNEPILDLYTKYLGEKATAPGSGVMFPISMYHKNQKEAVIRSFFGVDHVKKSITFTGDIPEGYKVVFMKTTFGKLVEGSKQAAVKSLEKNMNPSFALLISCLGRRVILKQHSEDELNIVREIVGKNCSIAGFYSYGEIGVSKEVCNYQLHNQTMTIALLSEK